MEEQRDDFVHSSSTQLQRRRRQQTSIIEAEQDEFQMFLNLTENDQHLPTELEESSQSFSTIEFDDETENEEHQFYYTSSSSSSSSPLFDYSPSRIESNHPIDLTEHHSSINDEDLSIEIILETSQNSSLANSSFFSSSSSSRRQRRRRRRSILPSSLLHNRGLRLSEILSIPQKLYSSLKQSIEENTQCNICLEDFQSSDPIKILHCQHVFHAECLNEWLRSHAKCAYCRTPVRPDLFRSTSPLTNRSGEHQRRQRTRPRRNQYLMPRSFRQIPLNFEPEPHPQDD